MSLKTLEANPCQVRAFIYSSEERGEAVAKAVSECDCTDCGSGSIREYVIEQGDPVLSAKARDLPPSFWEGLAPNFYYALGENFEEWFLI